MEKNPPPKAIDKPEAKQSANGSMARTIRETVESIVIAFVLAFLFRTFEAEAFVIPTGSMAPTLQGKHKDLVCPECKYQYRVGVQAQDEALNPNPRMSAVCPMCRYELPDVSELFKDEPRIYDTFEGDRILVNKFSYDLSEPRRWDVVVFKYPGDAKTNYIKRLIGLPGEHVYVGDPGPGFTLPRDASDDEDAGTGDIYVSTDDGKTRLIARKETPEKLVAMLQDVYDNDYVAASLLEKGWPSRWQNEGRGEGGWAAEEGTRIFSIDGAQNGEVWLRYHHLLPLPPRPQFREARNEGNILYQESLQRRLSAGSWENAADAERSAWLITDFYGYNTSEFPSSRARHGQSWVGDLAIECEVEFRGDGGELVLELVKGGAKFQARFDLASGEARLVIPGLPEYKPKAEKVATAPGTHQLRFANVDEQLWLFVDDEVVEFDSATTYESLNNYVPVLDPIQSPVGASDLSPVGVASIGADVRLSHLRIKRDVYYTRERQNEAIDNIALKNLADDELDQFFMLGDNSPASKDGRMWGRNAGYVERRLLIGKAVYIYWPHAIPASFSFPLPVFGSTKYIPFWPNFSQMKRVR